MDSRAILVPLDGSTTAESALEMTERFAEAGGTKLILVPAAEAPEDFAHVVAARVEDAKNPRADAREGEPVRA